MSQGYWHPPPFQSPPPDYHGYNPYANIPPYPADYRNHPPPHSQLPPHVHDYYQSQGPPPSLESAHPVQSTPIDPRSPRQQPYSPSIYQYDYGSPQLPDVSALNLEERPSSPQYVGRRAKSRASSKASGPTRPVSRTEPSRVDPRDRLPRLRKMHLAPLPGYKPPTVETAPNSPTLLPTLSSDSGSVFVVDEDYIQKNPNYSGEETCASTPEVSTKTVEQNPSFAPSFTGRGDYVPLDRTRTPYASSSATASTAASSPPPEKLPPLERERRQYAGTAVDQKEPQQKALHSAYQSNPDLELDRGYSTNTIPAESRPSTDRVPQPYTNFSQQEQQPYTTLPQREPQPYSPREPQSYTNPVSREPQPYANVPHREPQPYTITSQRHSQPCSPEQEPYPNVPQRESQPYTNAPQRQAQPYANAPQRGPQPYIHTPQQEPHLYTNVSEGEPQSYPNPAPREPQPYANVPRRETQSYVNSAHREPQPSSPQESQQYTKVSPREPHPHSHQSSSTSSAPKRRAQYASSSAELPFAREDLRSQPTPHSPQSSRSSHNSPIVTRQSPCLSKSPRTSPPITKDIVPTNPNPKEDSVALQSLLQRPATPQGEFLDLVPACPKRQPVSRGSWYRVSTIPGFSVCERCYEIHIYDTAFSPYFQEFKLSDGEKAFCAFNTPTIVTLVWPKTVEENCFDVFARYAKERGKVGTCTSFDIAAKEGVWYTIRGYRGGFIACQACYRDVILASPFHRHFGTLDAILSENTTPCHIAWPFIEARLLTADSTWKEIQDDLNFRLFKAPPCPGNQLIKDPGRRWWKPRGTVLPLYICDCCYWDGIFPTLFSDEFDQVSQGKKDAWCCAMSGYQLSVVWQYAAEKENITIWLDAAAAALSPMCSPDGARGQVWNSFRDSQLDGFDFCERCTNMFIKPLGFGRLLEKRRYSTGELIKCDLNPSNEHQPVLLQKLGEAAAWRDFGIFKQSLASLAPLLLPCPGIEVVRRNRWWGHDEFTVCEECWHQRVKHTALGGFVKEFNLRGASEESCDLGTLEWRFIWQKRCEMQDFFNFMEAIKLKNRLADIKRKRVDAMNMLHEKSRRGIYYDERKRLDFELRELQTEERDTTNMLAAHTRV